MGVELHRAAQAAGCEVVGIHDIDNPYNNALPEGYDVAIDFTEPSAVVHNVKVAGEHGKNIVIGTTGWNDQMDRIHAIQEKTGIGVLYGSNFSIGVQLFFRLAAEAGRLIDAVDEYDVMIHEAHHKRKKDSPSGTAITTAERLLSQIARKDHISTEAQHSPIAPEALHVSSTRGGEVVGRHTVLIDGPHDTIEIVHNAKNRTGFVQGALAAATWLHGKRGMYAFTDVFDEIVGAGA